MLQLCNAAVCHELVGNGQYAYAVDLCRMFFGEIFHHGFAESAQAYAVFHGHYASESRSCHLVEQCGVHWFQETHIVHGCRDALFLKLIGCCKCIVARVAKA